MGRGGPRTRSSVLAGEEAEGQLPEVLAGQGEIGRRAEDKGRSPDVLSGARRRMAGRRRSSPARTRSADARRRRAGRRTSLLARRRRAGHRRSLSDRTRSAGAWRTMAGRRTSLLASNWAGRRMMGKGQAADACLRGGGDGKCARWRRLQRRRAGGRGASKWS